MATLKEKGFSYHYIIRKDGTWEKLVPLSEVAFHAGESVGPHGRGVNEHSVGISFVNYNDGEDPYTDAQFDACAKLIDEIKSQCTALKWITTHYWISPGRKTDPKGFDIVAMAKRVGLEIWKPGSEA